MYQLYIGNKKYSSWSLRPWLLMRELQIPFTEKLVSFSKNNLHYKAFSPSGKVPTLVDTSETVWDSLAITEYLAEKYQNIWPMNIRARTWARSASAEIHSGFSAIRSYCPMNVGLRIQLHNEPDALKQDIKRLNLLWEEGLRRFGGSFLAGSKFTAVDAFFAPIAFRVQTYGLTLPAVSMGYVSHILALPGMQEWQKAAISESWRDESHEVETQRLGKLLQDLRVLA